MSARALACALLLTGGAARAKPTGEVKGSDDDRLPPAERRIVRARMQDHARLMNQLLWSGFLLQYDDAAAAAAAIARAATPLDREAPRLEHLVYFFSQQDALRSSALAVADAARAHDADALSTEFGRLTQTCIRCHAVYLEPSARAARR